MHFELLNLIAIVQMHHWNEKRKIQEYYDTLEKVTAEKGLLSAHLHQLVGCHMCAASTIAYVEVQTAQHAQTALRSLLMFAEG